MLEKRQSPRQEINFLAVIQTIQRAYEVVVLDISEKGIRIQTSDTLAALPLGSKLCLQLPLIADVTCELKWRNGSTQGLYFMYCPSTLKEFIDALMPEKLTAPSFNASPLPSQKRFDNESHFDCG